MHLELDCNSTIATDNESLIMKMNALVRGTGLQRGVNRAMWSDESSSTIFLTSGCVCVGNTKGCTHTWHGFLVPCAVPKHNCSYSPADLNSDCA